MRVKQIMTTDVRRGNKITTVDEAVSLMKECGIGFLPIVDEEAGRELIGVLTDRSILMRAVSAHLDLRLLPVTDVMAEEPPTIRPDDTVDRALRVMGANHLRQLAVVNKGKQLVGVISLGDIVRSEAVAPKSIAAALRKLYAPAKAASVNRSLLLKTCAA